MKALALVNSDDDLAATCPVCRAAQDKSCLGPFGRPDGKTPYARLAKSAEVTRWRQLGVRKTG